MRWSMATPPIITEPEPDFPRRGLADSSSAQTPSFSQPTSQMVERAAQWIAHLESGDADESDIAEFEAWQASHPAHDIAIKRLGGLHAQLHDNDAVGKESLRRLFLRPGRRSGGALLAALLIMGGAFMAWHYPAVQLYRADERTLAGETRDKALPDGSHIILGTDSAANLEYGDGPRDVHLLRGEILANVAPDHHRPFRVMTKDGTAEALGTSFTVRKDHDGTVVSVISSRVRACAAINGATGNNAERPCILLTSGQRARLSGGAVVPLTQLAPDEMAAWSEGWLSVEDRWLDEVLDELNRWRRVPVRFDRQSLSDLRVSGIFPLKDTDKALVNLSHSLPIIVDRAEPDSPVVRRR